MDLGGGANLEEIQRQLLHYMEFLTKPRMRREVLRKIPRQHYLVRLEVSFGSINQG